MLDTYLTWFRSHERLLLVLAVLGALAWGTSRIVDAVAAHDAARATTAEQALAAQKQIDAKLADQTAQFQSQYATLVSTLTKQVSDLSNSIISRQAGLQAQKGADAQLPVSGLATRLQTLGNVSQGVTSTPLGVNLTPSATLAVVQTLEQVPVLQADLKDEVEIASDRQKELDGANGVVVQLESQVSSLNFTVADGDKACRAELTATKAEARKSKSRWLRAGIVIGFIGGLLTGHAI